MFTTPSSYQTAVLFLIVAIIKLCSSQYHYVDYLDEDGGRGLIEKRPEDFGPELMQLLQPSEDMAGHSHGADRLISLDNGALLANILRQAVLRQQVAAAASKSTSSEIQKRANGRSWNRTYKKAGGPRRSRDSNYRQCFFNPISCFRK